MSLLEGIAATVILMLASVAAAGAMLAGAHAVAAPATRDQTLIAARNAAVEARAVSAYDAGATTAILAAPPSSWIVDGVALQSASAGTSLVISAAEGTQRATVTYRVAQEALPQGAIVDSGGNLLVP